MALKIDSGEIHVWCIFFEHLRDESLLMTFRELLNEEERQQETRFYFDRDRRRYLITRALVRTTLSRYANLSPQQWTFTSNEYGRPEISNIEPQIRKLSFNISHTNHLIALGIALDDMLGLDVENVKHHEVSLDVADRFFSLDEISDLYKEPPERRRQRFFELWTLKESYIKARGMGLAIPLDHFAFRFPRNDSVRLSIDPKQNDIASRWRFWQFRLRSEYLMAVCAQRVSDEPPKLIIKEVIPFVSEQPLDSVISRTSENN